MKLIMKFEWILVFTFFLRARRSKIELADLPPFFGLLEVFIGREFFRKAIWRFTIREQLKET
jgi:hypothetical protein